METDLKAGDEVFVHSGTEPKLSFVITEIVKGAGQLMAYGEYGCFAVDLLRKVESSSPTPPHKQVVDHVEEPSSYDRTQFLYRLPTLRKPSNGT